MSPENYFFFISYNLLSIAISRLLTVEKRVSVQTVILCLFAQVLKDAVTGALLETSSVSPRLGDLPIIEYPYDAGSREAGSDWPRYGYTMVGKKRLNQLHDALVGVVNSSIEGDFIECGVWRGGTSIFARLVWNAYDQTSRTVFVADSFAGLPPSTSTHDGRKWDGTPYLAVDLETVKRHFRHFGAAALENTVTQTVYVILLDRLNKKTIGFYKRFALK
jgi:hypothetical protein